VRDARARGIDKRWRWFQVAGKATSSIGAWMHEVRGNLGGRGWVLRAFGSQQATATAVLTVKCSVHSCTGCATSRLRLLCHQAQDCILAQCVGTVVQTRNVLCGIGGMLEQSARHALATWRALFNVLIELGLLVMRGRASEIAGTVTLRFPTDQVRRRCRGSPCTSKRLVGTDPQIFFENNACRGDPYMVQKEHTPLLVRSHTHARAKRCRQ
jgi:hypothetical protein